MLGLGLGQYASLVEPDYTLSPEQVCEALALRSVEQTGTLKFLSHLFEHQVTPGALDALWSLPGLEQNSFSEPYRHTCDSRLVAFWHTMRGGIEFLYHGSTRTYRRLKDSPRLLANCSKWTVFCSTPHKQWAKLWDHDLRSIMLVIEIATCDRRFFTTQQGYYGVGPQKCRVGDLVVVLAGGKVPYIIRPASRPRLARCYTILGDAYVHGIMDGEALQLPDGTVRELEEILLV